MHGRPFQEDRKTRKMHKHMHRTRRGTTTCILRTYISTRLLPSPPRFIKFDTTNRLLPEGCVQEKSRPVIFHHGRTVQGCFHARVESTRGISLNISACICRCGSSNIPSVLSAKLGRALTSVLTAPHRLSIFFETSAGLRGDNFLDGFTTIT